MQPPSTAQLAWYVTGRFYADAKNGTLQDVGYFLHLQGIDGELFCAAPGEASAHFTFAAVPFLSRGITNADISLSLDPVGDFSVFFNPQPGMADFSDPKTFAAGEEIAVFRRTGMVVGATVGGISSNVFSASLIAARPFTFKGKRHDLAQLLPHGITQWGAASTEPVTPPPNGYQKVVAFVGSALAAGGR